MGEIMKEEFNGKECYNCKWGTKRFNHLYQSDGTEMDTEAMDVKCEKTQKIHSLLDTCKEWEEQTSEQS